MNILVVDDEKLIRDVIIEYLVLDGFKAYEAANGEEAIRMAKTCKIDLIIMDIMMPKMDGYTACREIKKFAPDIPFIMLSARSEEYDKLIGFDLGIDDYVTKPFSTKELLARIKAITKRKINKDKIIIEGLVIDDLAHEVLVDGKQVNLTPKEYDLLKYLVENKNIAMSRETLLAAIWGFDYYGDDRTVDTHIKTIRNRLGKYRDMIKTIRGMGYKFEYKKEK